MYLKAWILTRQTASYRPESGLYLQMHNVHAENYWYMVLDIRSTSVYLLSV